MLNFVRASPASVFTLYGLACPIHCSHVYFFQGSELLPGRNLLINEYSLVIQSVNRSSAGKYVCVAFNQAGTGSSDQVMLDVKCKFVFKKDC